ncbi:MAG: beta-propeller fold lactonase family protein [Planctomycetota bacterium]
MKHLVFVVAAAASTLAAQRVPTAFVNFESPQTHPLAISADGSRLLAVNTPDNRLAVFSLLNRDRPSLLGEIPVGLEPVSVTPRTADEVWVVNRVSDSVSVVSLSRRAVIATIRVKDEPADVAFAGSPERAFVTVSGSREVRVFDPVSHALLATIPVFGEEPRALASSRDGSKVWVAVQRSGNGTTVLAEDQAPPPPAPTNPELPPAPQQSLIVDASDPTWQPTHGITLPDYDVFELDAAGMSIARRFSGVGTTLFNMAEHPTSGDLWVANSEARNLVRFEPSLRGHVVDSRLTRITTGAAPAMTFFDLNPGIDYSVLPNPAATASALAQPTDVVFAPDGSALWVAAFGTDRVASVNSAGAVTGFVELGAPGATADPRQKRGPRGLAISSDGARLYVLNRLTSTLAVIDTAARSLVLEQSLGYDPTPTVVREGRGFLYDAKLAGNGTASCAACHIDSEIDGIGWDLGDPGGEMKVFQAQQMHPMKGPMTTQTLRGLTDNTRPFHWRGDRDELQDFNPAFDTLLGGPELAMADMDAYADFIKTLAFPPNPNQQLDRTFSTAPAGESAQEGFNFYTTRRFLGGVVRCVDCHSLPTGTNGLIIQASLLEEQQSFKVPQLRNIYKRQNRTPEGGMSMSGFGLLHDGSVNNVFDLLTKPVFQSLSFQPVNKRRLERYMLEFDTGMAPTVGFTVDLRQATVGDPQVVADSDLLVQQAQLGNIDVVAKGTYQGAERSFAWFGGTLFLPDTAGVPLATLDALRSAAAAGNADLALMGVPLGSGRRIGIDRDLDGVLDGDERPVTYGQASPPCATPVALRANSPAFLGNDVFGVVADGAPPSALGVLLVGGASAALPFGGLTVLVDPVGLATLPLPTDASGTGIAALPIPSAPGLAGGSIFTQAAFGAPCSPIGVALSSGLQITID